MRKIKMTVSEVVYLHRMLYSGKRLSYAARKGSTFSKFMLAADADSIVLIGMLKAGGSLKSKPMSHDKLMEFLNETPIRLRGQFLYKLGVSRCQ